MNTLHLTLVPRDTMTSRFLNVVLFGETGSGKSAVINLLAGKTVAPTSSDIDGCTKVNQAYPLVINGVSYTIWDTVGLEQPVMGDVGHLNAIEQVCELIRDLSKTSGINLFLFCHRRGRITTTAQRNYVLLYEAVCRKSVPLAVVVTHLEQEERMEDWWDQNAVIFEQRGIEVFGHACVTTLAVDPKSQESKETLERLLGRHDSNGRYRMSTVKPAEVKETDLVKVLRKRCGLREYHASRIAQILAGADRTELT